MSAPLGSWLTKLAFFLLLLNRAAVALEPDVTVASILSEIQESMLYSYIAQLTGEVPMLVGGEPYTVLSRHTLSGAGIEKATQFAYEHMESLGLTTSYHDWVGCTISNPNISGRNVVGEKAGVVAPREIVIVMAHLDSTSRSGRAYGADDNASGSAAVLVAADLLSAHNFRRTIRFILTTGEEQGLCGSQAYAAMARERNDNIAAVYNLDMIAWESDGLRTLGLYTREPEESGYEDDLFLADTFIDVVSAYGLDTAPIVLSIFPIFGPLSDHVSFWNQGYPAILAIEDYSDDFSVNYHTSNDRLNTLNLSYLAANVAATAGTIAHMADIANPEMKLTLTGGGANAGRTSGSSAVARSGYAGVSLVSGAVPHGVAVFTFSKDGTVVSEAGIPASPPTTSARILIEYRSGVDAVPGRMEAGKVSTNTGIAVVNSGAADASVLYSLRDLNGNQLATGHGTVATGSHFACFIDQLKERAATDFELPANFPETIQFGSLEITSDQPLSIVALRGTMNQNNDFLITSTPVANLTKPPGNNAIYFPQFVDGGGYTSSILLLNTSDMPETGSLEIFDGKGAPLAVNQAGGTADSEFRYSIEPNGLFRFQTDGFPAEPVAGWVRVTPDAGTSTPAGSGVFAYNPGSVLVSESGVPATVPTTRARVYVDLSENHNTGLALANVADTGTGIAIHAYLSDGYTAIGSSEGLTLPAKGYAAAFADQFITGLPAGFTGVLDISSETPFAALTLRSLMNERHEFLMTTFPVADANSPAPAPIVFPQIADGGGYVTQFILISPAGEANATLDLYRENGFPWAIGDF